MNEPFVPLSPAPVPGRNRGDFKVTIVNQPGKLENFQPLGRPPKSDSAGQCEPRISLQRDGDRISAIRIQCTCGQTIDLACLYDSPKT